VGWRKNSKNGQILAKKQDRCINEYAEMIWNVEPLAPEKEGRSGLGKGEL